MVGILIAVAYLGLALFFVGIILWCVVKDHFKIWSLNRLKKGVRLVHICGLTGFIMFAIPMLTIGFHLVK